MSAYGSEEAASGWLAPARDEPHRHVHAYLRLFRPVAPVACLVVYLVPWLLSGSTAAARIMAVLGVSSAFGLLYLVLLRWIRPVPLVRVTLFVDLAIVAALVAVLDRPEVASAALLWSCVIAAYFLSWRFTAVMAVLGAVAAGVVTQLRDASELSLVEQVSGPLVVLVIGMLLAFMAAQARTVERELRQERELDHATLLLARRINTAVEPELLLRQVPRALGEALDVARSTLRLLPPWEGLYEWHVPELSPVGDVRPPDEIVARLAAGEVYVSGDLSEAEQAFYDEIGVASAVAIPLLWRGVPIAGVSLQDRRQREWSTRELGLLQQLAPLLAAALVQARSRQELQRLGEVREQVVARVSHELRTPLTSTLGFLETLLRQDVEFTDEQRRQYLELAAAGARRLAALISDLSDFTLLQRGQSTLQLRDTQLEQLVQEAVDSIPVPPDRDVELVCAEGAAARLRADERRVSQVVINLVTNALRHGRGTVRVRMSADADRARVAVTDDGAGVPDEALDQLFEPFTSWSSHSESTGLGLAIARGIAEAHGGALEYRHGSADTPHEFELELPLAGPEEQDAGGDEGASAP